MQSHFAGEPYIWNHTQSFRGNIMYFFSTLYYFCAFNFPVFHVSLCSICFHQNFYCDLFLLLHAGLARLVDSPQPHQDAKLSAPWPRSFCDVSELLIAFKCWASSGCKPWLKVGSNHLQLFSSKANIQVQIPSTSYFQTLFINTFEHRDNKCPGNIWDIVLVLLLVHHWCGHSSCDIKWCCSYLHISDSRFYKWTLGLHSSNTTSIYSKVSSELRFSKLIKYYFQEHRLL